MKIIIYISLCITLLCCHNDNSDRDNESNNTISFATDIGSADVVIATRGELVTTQTISSFGIYAYESFDAQSADAADFMTNQSVMLGDNNSWNYSPIQMWEDKKLLFYAYSPYALSGDTNIKSQTSGGELIIDYTVPTDVSAQYDLMLATPIQQSSGSVKLSFEHKLSAVTFSITGDQSRVVTSVVVSGLNNSARLTQSYDGDVEWSNITCDQDVKYIVSVTPNIIPTTEKQSLTAEGYTLMMIPQTIPSTAQVIVKSAAVNDPDDIQIETLYFDEITTAWESNKQYIYTMNINTNYVYDGDLDANATVVDWVTNDDVTLW